MDQFRTSFTLLYAVHPVIVSEEYIAALEQNTEEDPNTSTQHRVNCEVSEYTFSTTTCQRTKTLSTLHAKLNLI